MGDKPNIYIRRYDPNAAATLKEMGLPSYGELQIDDPKTAELIDKVWGEIHKIV